jgi:capsular exopolysaccharide synthesis family protein
MTDKTTRAPDALGLLRALKRRWLLAVCLGIIVAGSLAAGVWFFLPPAKEIAYAKVAVMNQVGAVFQHPEANTDSQTYLRTQVAYLRSPLVIDSALNDPEVAKLSFVQEHYYPGDWILQQLKIDFPDGPQIPRLYLKLENPDEARLIIAAIIKVYFDEVIDRDKNDRARRLKWLQNLSDDAENRLAGIKKKNKGFAQLVGAADPKNRALKQEMALKELRSTREELSKVTAQLVQQALQVKHSEGTKAPAMARATALAVSLPASPASSLTALAAAWAVAGKATEIPEQMVEEIIDKDKDVAKARAAIKKTEIDLAQARNRFKNQDDRAIRTLEDRLDVQKKGLDEVLKEARPEAMEAVRKRLEQTAQREVELAKEKIAYLKEYREILEKEKKNLEAEAQELNQGNLNLDEGQDDLNRVAKFAELMASKRDELKVEMDAPARVKLLEPARIERIESTPRKIRFAGLAGLGGLGLTFFAIGFLEFRRRRLDSPETAVRELGIQIVGTVPSCPSSRRLTAHKSNELSYYQQVLTHSIDAARISLIHHASRGELKTIMIASALPGEGKTSLTSHLAVSMARAGFKTLVVDGDLRNPALHELFGQSIQPGLCDLLKGECTTTEACQATSIEHLSLLPAGRCSSQVLRLLAQGKARHLFEQLKQEYDFIILDSSPVLLVSDVLLVAQQVDGVLFSMLCQVSCLPQVQEAYERLAILGVPVLGAVVSGTPARGYYGTHLAYATSTVD